MCKFYILTHLVLFHQHLVQCGNSLVILFRVCFAEVILGSLHKHDWRCKFVSDLEVSNQLCVVSAHLHVNLRPYFLHTVKDRLIAFLILLEITHILSVLYVDKHCLSNRSDKVLVYGQVHRIEVDDFATSQKRRLRIIGCILLCLIRVLSLSLCISHVKHLQICQKQAHLRSDALA